MPAENPLVSEERISPPQQSRSLRTMNRILNAAVDLLEEKNFADLTIAEIVEKAGCSVGAFYGRFRDKDALLHALDERYFREFDALAGDLLRQEAWLGKSLQEVVRTIVSVLISMHREKRGLRRTLILQARSDPDPRFRQREQSTWEIVPRLVALLMGYRSQIGHPNPPLAIELGFLQVFYAIREMVLWDHIAGHVPASGDELVDELTRAYLAYLGATPST